MNNRKKSVSVKLPIIEIPAVLLQHSNE